MGVGPVFDPLGTIPIPAVYSPPEHILFRDALLNLKNSHSIYLKNWYVFVAMDTDRRTHWIEHVKRQAEAGLPFAVALVQSVMLRRLKGD